MPTTTDRIEAAIAECERQSLVVNVRKTGAVDLAPLHTLLRELLADRNTLERIRSTFLTPITCLCGSTKFKAEYIQQMERWTRAGHIVLTVGFFDHADNLELTPAQKAKLDELHLRKIDLTRYVYVLDVGGYIGDSTKAEIEYAESQGKAIRYFSKDPDAAKPSAAPKKRETK